MSDCTDSNYFQQNVESCKATALSGIYNNETQYDDAIISYCTSDAGIKDSDCDCYNNNINDSTSKLICSESSCESPNVPLMPYDYWNTKLSCVYCDDRTGDFSDIF